MRDHAAGDNPAAGRKHRKENPVFQPSRPPCPPLDITGRVVAAIRKIGRPVTRSELTQYGSCMYRVPPLDLEATLEQLVVDGLVAAVDRVEPYKRDGRVTTTRRYYTVVDRPAGD